MLEAHRNQPKTQAGVFISSGVLKVKASWSSLNKPYRALYSKVNILTELKEDGKL